MDRGEVIAWQDVRMALGKRRVSIRLLGGPYAGKTMKMDTAPNLIGLGSPIARYERVPSKGASAVYRYTGRYAPVRARKVLGGRKRKPRIG